MHRGTRWPSRTARAAIPVGLLVLALAALPLVAALDSADALSGYVFAPRLSTQSANASLLDFEGLHAYAPLTVPLYESLRIQGERVTVNLTHRTWDSYAQSPNRPDEFTVAGFATTTYDEFERRPAALEAIAVHPEANLLVLADAAGATANLTLVASSWSTVTQETWWAGDYAPDGRAQADDPLQQYYEPEPGLPAGFFNRVERFEAHGDFHVYVWGANVTLTNPNGTREAYRTGTWSEDEVRDPATGYVVAAKTHAQLMRLELVNAVVTVEHLQGPTAWASREARVASEESIRFEDATLHLETPQSIYQASDQDVTLRGQLTANLTGTGTLSTLHAQVTGRSVLVDLPPGAPPPTPQPVAPRAAPLTDSEQGSAGLATGPKGGGNSYVAGGWWTAGAFAVAGVLGGAVFVNRRAGTRAPHVLLRRSQVALADGDALGAEKLARSVLQKDPANSRAWFLVAASLLKRGEYDRVVEVLEGVMERFDPEMSGLAYLIAFAHHELGQPEKANRWLPVVARDPAYWNQLGQDTDFDVLVRRFMDSPHVGRHNDPAYA